MNEIIQENIQVIVGLLALGIAGLIVGLGGSGIIWVKARWESIKDSSPEKLIDIIEYVADVIVRGVEQKVNSGQLDLDARLSEAVNLMEKYLLTLGYTVDLDVIKIAIENAVARLKDEFKDAQSTKSERQSRS
jgi:hypothetical protein